MGAAQSYSTKKLSSDRTVVITGGNTGIGYETAKTIAGFEARVVIACRDEQRAMEAIKKMNIEYEEFIKTKTTQKYCQEQTDSSRRHEKPSTPQENTSTPLENTTNSHENTSTPQENTSTLLEITSNSQENSSTSLENTSNSHENISPQENSSTPLENTSISQENTSTPQENTSTPLENTSNSHENTPTPLKNISMPLENTSNSQENTSMPQDNTSTSQTNSPIRNDTAIKLNVEFMKLDLTSLQSTMEFIEAYKASKYPLHVLICNAGIANARQAYTVDGYESQFQVNYLSHFLITLHLLPIMRESGTDCRIVHVSSLGHRLGEFDLENIQGQRSYSRLQFYANSKMYQVMNMYSLHRRLHGQGISVLSLHPGQIATEINRNFNDSMLWWSYDYLVRTLGILRPPDQGAETTIMCAVSPDLEGVSGVYFSTLREEEPCVKARDVKAQEELWRYSLECLKPWLLSVDVERELLLQTEK